MLSARTLEADLLDRCSAAATGLIDRARDARDANVFNLASMVLQSRLPEESRGLKRASDAYFASHPSDKFDVREVLRNRWVESLPRLRDLLTAQLTQATGVVALSAARGRLAR